jgi:hypothetical protein
MSKTVPDYAMFSSEGNAAVHGIVCAAIPLKMDWDEILTALITLAKTEGFGEAMDTAVRECVYMKVVGE